MMMSSNYDEIDFAKLYIEQKKISTFKPKSSADWDKKASSMNESVHKSYYADEFVSKIKFDKSTTVLDMGCGPGTIGLKLAKHVKNVLCCDYSDEMLKCVKQNARNLNLDNVSVKKISFEDNWEELPKCDIVTASRCLAVKDAKDALTKLISKANKAVYITYNTGKTFLDDEISEILSSKVYPKPDYIYILNILYQMGYRAKVDFIGHSDCKFKTETFDEFITAVQWSYGEKVNDADRQNLKIYYEKNRTTYKEMSWAFIEILV
ncbi:class I SAM-dependent methyltransferase [Campylobacter fetus]|uniref:class I SAM-dependent methyltransferase n=1 Tax=Campylobacter fetus TaxID=196 RepID=UPI0003C28E81|nr:methyltransferase domain-containing protein [Campylobacter fetus]AGZ81175.1 SAM-dependent methyltransferase [Campylobacter fetus subsp. testudinum 03-427]EAI4321575.1 methyltransferase domain-containing protein [Campylobacter fetus]EAI4391429.1 methyltransferase domain-containing protein [Campylobacter fetus]OCS07259.1 SAM-dependent methyltransferase [Campylobacter fetus subsp. testudinum]OCS08884.1 SAM-dependent methyltransferase [Campylobacter fetus subsp. testudinum]